MSSWWRVAALAFLCVTSIGAAAPPAPLTGPERRAILRVLSPSGRDDQDLLAAARAYATQELGQRVRPRQVDRLWSIEPEPRNVAAELAAAREQGRLDGWLASLAPPFAGYHALLAARVRYAQLVRAGGWPRLAAGPPLREGDRGPSVARLRVRLVAEGFLNSPDGDVFDHEVKAGLVDIQRSRALEADGILGPATLEALNVTATDRLAQIDANLERWRWLPRALPNDRLEVDIGGAEATLFQDGRSVLGMRAIVGDPGHHTPMFASRLEAVIVNPPWRVPSSIASKEILPRARRDRGYLARNGFTFVQGQLVQRPGPKNSLGILKFDLPSPFGVYLHDTPSKSLFQQRSRTLSHGCVRLEKPRELAVILLEDRGVTHEELEKAITSGRTRRIELHRPMPLYVLYWTVIAEPPGKVVFRPDVYGWDAKLNAALAGHVARAQLKTNTDCADGRETGSDSPQD